MDFPLKPRQQLPAGMATATLYSSAGIPATRCCCCALLDSEAEATQFADAYRRALAVKYKDSKDPSRVERQGVDVFIVEGGREADLGALIDVVKQAKKTRT